MKKEVKTGGEKLLYMAIHDLKNQLTLVKANIACLAGMDLGAWANELAGLSEFGAG